MPRRKTTESGYPVSEQNMSSKELLQYALENGIIDITQIQASVEMTKRDELLAKHPYDIWQGSGGNWYTYLPDKKKGRVQRKRTTRKALEDLVVSYWKQQSEDPTVEDLFNEWLKGKVDREEITVSTRDRYICQFKQCFEEFRLKKVKHIEPYEIEDFILNTIHEQKLTPKGYSGFRTLIFGIFRLSKKRQLVDFSITQIVSDMDISKKIFRKVVHTDEEQVFSEDELPIIENYLMENLDLLNLGLLLLFKTGLRVGELSALETADIKWPDVLCIHRTEIRYKDEKEKTHYEVRDFPKTDAGIREVIIPQNSLWILRKIHILNPFGKYLFETDGNRVKTYTFRKRLKRVCATLNIFPKSPHKVRKTYGTILIDENVDEAVVIGQMGHTDIRTTRNHYYKNRKSLDRKRECINKISAI